jgi:hypothetical protein
MAAFRPAKYKLDIDGVPAEVGAVSENDFLEVVGGDALRFSSHFPPYFLAFITHLPNPWKCAPRSRHSRLW